MSRSLTVRTSALRTALLAASALTASGCSWLPPDLQDAPTYLYELVTNDEFVVNTPVLHEIFGHARGIPDEATRNNRFRLAPGFELTVFATGIPHPRTLRVTETGDLIVTQPRKGRVLIVVRDADGDGRSDETRVLAEGLDLPHGVELVGETLFVAEPHRISRARFDTDRSELVAPLEPFIELPKTEHHNNRTLRLGPDGWLYYPIGANCNLCEPETPREGTLLRVRPDGQAEEVFASGFRNIAGFDWQPRTNVLYANDIGADYQGDDFPPEELNRIDAGAFYGFPYAHGDGLPDPEFGPGNEARVASAEPPALTFPAHATPLGLIFLRAEGYPHDYSESAVVALHGSWNKREKVGYKLVSLHWRKDGTIESRDFLVGFEIDEDVVGRPVDVAEGPDASIYISDDYAGAIYRVRVAQQAAPRPVSAQDPPAIDVPAVASRRDERDMPRALVTAGEQLFKANACGSCHLPGGESGAYIPLRELAVRYDRRDLVALLSAPPAAMPRAILADDEREALAAYLLSCPAPRDLRTDPSEMRRDGLAGSLCAR